MSSATKTRNNKIVRLFVIDTNRSGLSLRRQILTDAGYDVSSCHQIEEAAALVEKEKFAAIVVGWKLHGEPCTELLGKLRAASPTSAIIIVAAPADSTSAKEAHADRVVEKSANEVMHLQSAVRYVLNKQPRKGVSKQAGTKKRARTA
jgi:DNA-binding NtrC family response regulator